MGNDFLDDLPDLRLNSRRKSPGSEGLPIDKCFKCGKENPWTVEKTEVYTYFIRRLRQCKFCNFQIRTREKVEN